MSAASELRNAQSRARAAATHLSQASHFGTLPTSLRERLRLLTAAWLSDADALDALVREANLHLEDVRRKARGAL